MAGHSHWANIARKKAIIDNKRVSHGRGVQNYAGRMIAQSYCGIFIFIVGLILYTTLALLTPYLQTLMNYPVVTAGVALAPRGAGTMLAMMVCGRLVGKEPAAGRVALTRLKKSPESGLEEEQLWR